jgi:hypothetical protein
MLDFGTKTEPRAKTKTRSKKLLFIPALIFILAGCIFLLAHKQAKNPLPPAIKSRISYRFVYPAKTNSISQVSYKYQADQSVLTFSSHAEGTKVVFIEQPAPASLGAGNQIYFPAIGIHPYAQFQSKLGPVALTKFYKPNTLDPAGQTGILAAHGTLVIAHPDKDLSNDQWKNLFNSLTISK